MLFGMIFHCLVGCEFQMTIQTWNQICSHVYLHVSFKSTWVLESFRQISHLCLKTSWVCSCQCKLFLLLHFYCSTDNEMKILYELVHNESVNFFQCLMSFCTNDISAHRLGHFFFFFLVAHGS